MPIDSRLIEYRDGETRCQGFFVAEAQADRPLPAVLIAHTWAGRNAFVEAKARQLAGQGYAAFALDMYGDGRTGSTPEECAQLMSPLMENRSRLQTRITAGLDCLRAQAEVDAHKIAAMGFCFGGLCVLDLARSGADLQGIVSFHGLLTPPETSADVPITAKILVLHGHDDPMAPPEQIIALGRELTDRGADWQMHLFGHTAHAFTNPDANDPGLGTVYHPAADRRSWRYLMDFLDEVLE
jgi:dienelactone hydrolase